MIVHPFFAVSAGIWRLQWSRERWDVSVIVHPFFAVSVGIGFGWPLFVRSLLSQLGSGGYNGVLKGGTFL